MAHWILAIQEYDFEIKHCKGRGNIVTSILNRNPEDIDAKVEDRQENLEINKVTLKISKECMGNIKQIARLLKEDNKMNAIINTIRTPMNLSQWIS